LNFDVRDNIRIAMQDRCFTQSSIAVKAHMSPSVLSMVLNKKRRLEANELYDLCEAMEISPTELRTRYKPKIPEKEVV
jgi:transcriptional regulator with XRE-family HTH domain